MDLLITPSLFESYFNSLMKMPKSEHENDISALINNPLNRFVISRDYIEFLERAKFSDSISSIVLPFLSELINNKSLKVASDGLTDEDAILEAIDTKYNSVDKSKKKDLYLKLSKKDTNQTYNVNLTKTLKPNKDWLLFKLSCYHPNSLTIRYYEFSADKQIQDLISSIFLSQDSAEVINIMDRQANFQHKLFNSFKQHKQVHYYTTHNTLQQDVESFKKNFKKLKVFCAKPTEIHERKVFCKNLIVELDDDFWNISIEKTTWKIEITYCPIVVSKLKEKLKPFKRVIIS